MKHLPELEGGKGITQNETYFLKYVYMKIAWGLGAQSN